MIPANMKIDGQMTIMGFTAKMKLSNRSVEKAVERLRGNQRTIAKRLLYDFRNAVNSGRDKAPCIHNHNGRLYLRTSPSLIVNAEDFSFTPRTAKNCLRKLVDRGAVALDMIQLGQDILIMIDEELLEWYEPKTSPQEPPESAGGHMEAKKRKNASSSPELKAMAAKFNRKHHTR